jgi:hypothetical protein
VVAVVFLALNMATEKHTGKTSEYVDKATKRPRPFLLWLLQVAKVISGVSVHPMEPIDPPETIGFPFPIVAPAHIVGSPPFGLCVGLGVRTAVGAARAKTTSASLLAFHS